MIVCDRCQKPLKRYEVTNIPIGKYGKYDPTEACETCGKLFYNTQKKMVKRWKASWKGNK